VFSKSIRQKPIACQLIDAFSLDLRIAQGTQGAEALFDHAARLSD
jgi:hypothetical protein